MIASAQNEQAPVTKDGKLQVSVNTYSTVTQTAKVTYAVYMEDKAVTPQRSMTRQTDFNWTDAVKLPPNAKDVP